MAANRYSSAQDSELQRQLSEIHTLLQPSSLETIGGNPTLDTEPGAVASTGEEVASTVVARTNQGDVNLEMVDDDDEDLVRIRKMLESAN